MFVIRVENPCYACVTLCANFGDFGLACSELVWCKSPEGYLHGEIDKASWTSPRGENEADVVATSKGGVVFS